VIHLLEFFSNVSIEFYFSGVVGKPQCVLQSIKNGKGKNIEIY